MDSVVQHSQPFDKPPILPKLDAQIQRDSLAGWLFFFCGRNSASNRSNWAENAVIGCSSFSLSVCLYQIIEEAMCNNEVPHQVIYLVDGVHSIQLSLTLSLVVYFAVSLLLTKLHWSWMQSASCDLASCHAIYVLKYMQNENRKKLHEKRQRANEEEIND